MPFKSANFTQIFVVAPGICIFETGFRIAQKIHASGATNKFSQKMSLFDDFWRKIIISDSFCAFFRFAAWLVA